MNVDLSFGIFMGFLISFGLLMLIIGISEIVKGVIFDLKYYIKDEIKKEIEKIIDGDK